MADTEHCSGVVLVLSSWIHLTCTLEVPSYKNLKRKTHGNMQSIVPRIPWQGGLYKPCPLQQVLSRGMAKDRQPNFRAADRKLARQDGPLQDSYKPDLRAAQSSVQQVVACQ